MVSGTTPTDNHVPSRLRAFVSSRMAELSSERSAIKRALAEVGIDTFVFEDDAGARPQGIRDTYLDALEAADVYIGLFASGYGAYTVEEFEHAQLLGLDCLVYERHDGQPRDPALQLFLERISHVESGAITPDRYHTEPELLRKLLLAVQRWREHYRPPPPRESAGFRGIPALPPANFIGRDRVLSQAAAQLRSGADVAIEGLPGVGKTSLVAALVQHRGVQRRFVDGVLWASLGPRADPAEALLRWSQAVDGSGALSAEIALLSPVAAKAARLREAIHDRILLLVIDDAWEASSACTLRCGGPRAAHLLSTRDKGVARAFLGSSGALSLAELDESAALTLLEALAPEACAASRVHALQLARAVGGLPLALQLVGAQLADPQAALFSSVFPELGEDAFAQLIAPAERLRLVGERLAGRRVTLAETILMSVDALPDKARRAFFSLGAFASKPERFDRSAAEQVTGEGARALAALAAHHLIEVQDSDLMMHPTVSDVARTQQPVKAATAHREHLLQRAQTAGDDVETVAALYGQLRWAFQQAPEDLTVLQVTFLRAIAHYQVCRGLYAERLTWAERCLPIAEAQESAEPEEVAHVLAEIGRMQRSLKRPSAAAVALRRRLQLADPSAPAELRVDMRIELALALGRADGLAAALQELDAAGRIADDAHLTGHRADIAAITSLLLRDAGRHLEAEQFGRDALQRFQARGDTRSEADTRTLLASILSDSEVHGRASEHLEQALQLELSAGSSPARLVELWSHISAARRGAGLDEEALAAAERALEYAELSDVTQRIGALTRLGDLHRKRREFEQARTCYARCLSIAQESGQAVTAAIAYESLAWVAVDAGAAHEALSAARAALALREREGDLRGLAASQETLARAHAAAHDPEAHALALVRAAELWRAVGDQGNSEAALQQLTRAHHGYEDLDGKCRVLAAAADLLLDAPQVAGDVLARVQRRRVQQARYGRLALELLGASDSVKLLYPADLVELPVLEGEVERLRADLRRAYGWRAPSVSCSARTHFPSQHFQIYMFGALRVSAALPEAGRERALVERLAQLLRENFAAFVGHQEVCAALNMRVPEALPRFCADSVALSGLVQVLRLLASEHVPLTELPAIVAAFELHWARHRCRLAVLQAVRQLAELRPLLPGNSADVRALSLDLRWESAIRAGICRRDGMLWLSCGPELYARLLEALHRALPAPGEAALVVSAPDLRRFVRRIIELEFPDLPVLAQAEHLHLSAAEALERVPW